jgi:O-antigen/teichoic acid export membrane protein
VEESSLQLRARHIARNVLFNWAGTIANMAVGFLLSPFILHRLGDVAYGVWVLAVSVVGYLGLLDLGIGLSILRFVSLGYTKQDHESASEALSAALWVRLQISAVVLILSAVLAAVFPHIFTVPPQLARDAREAILIIGTTTAITMSMGLVGTVISALNRYDLQTYASFTQTVIRVAGIIFVLRTGHGIVAIALCELAGAFASRIVQFGIARRLYPELRVRLAIPKKQMLQKIWSYSSYTFLITIAVQLVYQTDNLVVGAFVSTAAVTFYAIANSLCRYTTQIVGAMAGTFMPAASTFDAAGDKEGLLMLYKNGTRATIMVSLPVIITLIIRGSSFIGLWMGPRYSHTSGIVLTILCVPLVFSFANQTPGAIAFGTEKHKILAFWAVGEGVLNLVLSIVLARRYGIYGVAIGTLIPSLISQIIFWPLYTSRLVPLSAYQVIVTVWGPMMLSSIPFAIATYMIEIHFPAHNLAEFALQVGMALVVFLLSVAAVFRIDIQTYVWPRLRSLLVT